MFSLRWRPIYQRRTGKRRLASGGTPGPPSGCNAARLKPAVTLLPAVSQPCCSPKDAWAGARLSRCSSALAPLPAHGLHLPLNGGRAWRGSPGEHPVAHGRWGVCSGSRPPALGRRCQGVCASHAAWQLRVENSWGLVPSPAASAVARDGTALPRPHGSAASSRAGVRPNVSSLSPGCT